MDSPIYHLEHVVKAKTEDLEDFVGPLDLILHLLSKNKMEIQDIQLSLILDQYLDWMRQRKELDLEVASEFVTMASHLIYIKTRMLLSIHDEEAMSEMEQLIATLEAHQRGENYLKIKEVVPQLDSRYTYGRDFLTKEPEPLQPNREYHYVHPREDLKKAMLAVLARSDNKLPPPVSAFQGIVGREPYPVAEKAMEILNRLLRLGVTRFRSLFQGSRSRSEVVATFLAVLELCRAHRLRLAGTAEDCTVTSTGTGAPEEQNWSKRMVRAARRSRQRRIASPVKPWRLGMIVAPPRKLWRSRKRWTNGLSINRATANIGRALVMAVMPASQEPRCPVARMTGPEGSKRSRRASGVISNVT